MSDWNEEPVRTKDKRRGVIEQSPVKGGRNKQTRQWKVVGPGFFKHSEFVWHRAATKEACEAWLAKQARSYYVSRRDTEQQREAAQRQAEQRASSYRIVGPKE